MRCIRALLHVPHGRSRSEPADAGRARGHSVLLQAASRVLRSNPLPQPKARNSMRQAVRTVASGLFCPSTGFNPQHGGAPMSMGNTEANYSFAPI